VDKDRLGKGERRDLQSNSIISIGLSPRMFKVNGKSTAASWHQVTECWTLQGSLSDSIIASKAVQSYILCP